MQDWIWLTGQTLRQSLELAESAPIPNRKIAVQGTDMKVLASVLLAVLFSISAAAQADDMDINYCKDLTAEDFYAAAKWSFAKRKYQIEEDTPSSVIGAQKGKKVQIAMTAPGQIAIRWVPGFGYTSDGWLKNLKYDMLWKLAGKAEQGMVSINWCKDLSEDDFNSTAKLSLEQGRYQIEEDTSSRLIGSQQGKKVEIAMTEPGHIVIRWVPGFGYSSDKWLRNVFVNLTWHLAE